MKTVMNVRLSYKAGHILTNLSIDSLSIKTFFCDLIRKASFVY